MCTSKRLALKPVRYFCFVSQWRNRPGKSQKSAKMTSKSDVRKFLIFHETPYPELNVLDLAHNKLRAIPERLEDALGLLVLNLSHNQIAEIPPATFVNLCDLMHLDISHNQLGFVLVRLCTVV